MFRNRTSLFVNGIATPNSNHYFLLPWVTELKPEALAINLLIDKKPLQLIPSATEKAPIRHILRAGCRDDQTNAETIIEICRHEAFTFYLCRYICSSGNTSPTKPQPDEKHQ